MRLAVRYIGKTLALVAAVAIVSASPLARTQPKPNFTGAWTGTVESQAADALPAWAHGQSVTIKQDASVITIEYVSTGRNHNRVLLTYKLDGTETTNNPAFGPPVTAASTAAWDGTTLVLTTAYSGTTGTPSESRERLTLESSTAFKLESSHTRSGKQTTSVARFRRSGSWPSFSRELP